MPSAQDDDRASTIAAPRPASDLARTMRQIYDRNLTTTSGGNLSLRGRNTDGRDVIWITPAGLDKGELRPEQVARVDADSRHRDGHPNHPSLPHPSSELPFHRTIYAARPDLSAIAHAHPVSLVAFSIAQQVPDTRSSAWWSHLCGRIGFAPYALPGSRRLGESIAATFAKGFDCVVLENHGAVVGGHSLRHAFERLEALDLCARTILRSRALGREHVLPPRDLELVQTAGGNETRPTSEPLPVEHRAERERLCTLMRRACTRKLMTSSQGSFSARLADDVFLITPVDRPRDRLTPEDLAMIDLSGERTFDNRADEMEVALHAGLYRAHAEVHAIAHGHGEHASAFGLAHQTLPARTIPESYILVRDPPSIPYRRTRLAPESVPNLLGPGRPVALIENDGAIALGTNPLDAFDRLEVLEATAAAVIESRSLGDMRPMNDERLAELRDAFFKEGGFPDAPHGNRP